VRDEDRAAAARAVYRAERGRDDVSVVQCALFLIHCLVGERSYALALLLSLLAKTELV